MPPSPNTLPDFHFLLIAPGLGAEWLFDAARLYWERFRPTVIQDLGLVRLLPNTYTIAITAVARRDTIPQIGVSIAQALPDALFDRVVYDFFNDMKQVLDLRAQLNQPFGVELAPTPAPPSPLPPNLPTPGAVINSPGSPVPMPTRPPGGFITATPQPTNLPITPTPGPITNDG